MALEPSLAHTQISIAFPERADLNAIRFPSGEYAGSSSVSVDEISLTGDKALARRKEALTFQI